MLPRRRGAPPARFAARAAPAAHASWPQPLRSHRASFPAGRSPPRTPAPAAERGRHPPNRGCPPSSPPRSPPPKRNKTQEKPRRRRRRRWQSRTRPGAQRATPSLGKYPASAAALPAPPSGQPPGCVAQASSCADRLPPLPPPPTTANHPPPQAARASKPPPPPLPPFLLPPNHLSPFSPTPSPSNPHCVFFIAPTGRRRQCQCRRWRWRWRRPQLPRPRWRRRRRQPPGGLPTRGWVRQRSAGG